MTDNGSGPLPVTGFIDIIICLHGSSLISYRDNFKRLDQIDDEVLSGIDLNQYAKVKSIGYKDHKYKQFV